MAPTTPSIATLSDQPREHVRRHAESVRLVQQPARQRRRRGVTDAGNQPHDGLDAEPDIGAG